MKRRLLTVSLLVIMTFVGIATIPNAPIGSREFWQWLTLLLFVTILVAYVFLGEDAYALFDRITLENLKGAPVFGILAIPLVVSVISLIVIGLKEFILNNL